MADIVKPLRYKAGRIGQLQPGEQLETGDDQVTRQTSETITLGEVVFDGTVPGEVTLGRADVVGTSDLLGMALETKTVGLAIAIKTQKDVQLTVGQWDTVIEESSPTGLVPGAFYFLSRTTAGAITTTPPPKQNQGEFSVRFGRASTTTVLFLDIQRTIDL